MLRTHRRLSRDVHVRCAVLNARFYDRFAVETVLKVQRKLFFRSKKSLLTGPTQFSTIFVRCAIAIRDFSSELSATSTGIAERFMSAQEKSSQTNSQQRTNALSTLGHAALDLRRATSSHRPFGARIVLQLRGELLDHILSRVTRRAIDYVVEVTLLSHACLLTKYSCFSRRFKDARLQAHALL